MNMGLNFYWCTSQRHTAAPPARLNGGDIGLIFLAQINARHVLSLSHPSSMAYGWFCSVPFCSVPTFGK